MIFFDDNFATTSDLLPGRYTVINYAEATIGGINCVTATGATDTSIEFTPTASDDFVIQIVGGTHGLYSVNSEGSNLIHLTNTNGDRYSAGQVGGNITYITLGTQTNTGLSFEGIYSIDDLKNSGTTLIFRWTKIDNDSSQIALWYYTDVSQTVLLASGTATVPAGILGTYVVKVDNPSVSETEGVYIQRIATYTPDSSCFAEGSLIPTTDGVLPLSDIVGKYVYDGDGNPAKVVKVWKTVFPLEELCYVISDTTVTGQHMVNIEDHWIQAKQAPFIKSETRKGYFYQIQTETYGVTIDGVVFATWTQKHVDENPIDMI